MNDRPFREEHIKFLSGLGLRDHYLQAGRAGSEERFTQGRLMV